MKNTITILGTEILIKEFRNKRVLTLRDIDALHKRPYNTAARNFSTNRDRFVKNEDYFIATVTGDLFRQKYGLSPNAKNTVTFITETGYLMLVKTFTDELAWKVQRALVNYFEGKSEIVQTVETTQPTIDEIADLKMLIQQQNLFLQEQKEMLTSFCSMMQHSMQLLASYVTHGNEVQAVDNSELSIGQISERKIEKLPMYIAPAKDEIYKKKINSLCTQICEMHGGFENRKEVLDYLRAEITKKYGICWEQELKEYRQKYGRRTHYLDMIASADESKHYKSILMAMATDMLAECTKEVTEVRPKPVIMEYVNDETDINKAIQNIAIELGYSEAQRGVAVTRKLIKQIQNKYSFDLNEMKNAYRQIHRCSGHKRISILMLADENEEIKKALIKELNALIETINS